MFVFGIAYGMFGFLSFIICLRWLFKACGHFAILFGTFLELPKCSPNIVQRAPYLSQKHFEKYKEVSPNIFRNIMFTYLNISKHPKTQDFGNYQTSTLKTCSCFIYSGRSKTIGFSEGFQTKRNLRWWNIDK